MPKIGKRNDRPSDFFSTILVVYNFISIVKSLCTTQKLIKITIQVLLEISGLEIRYLPLLSTCLLQNKKKKGHQLLDVSVSKLNACHKFKNLREFQEKLRTRE